MESSSGSSASDDSRAGSAGGPPSDYSGLHVAIIMDGNGRWAKARGMPRTLGHRSGVAALKRTVQAAQDLGVEKLTVFGFSTENWRRPAREVSELMGLLKAFVDSDLERLAKEGVRVRVLGRREGLDTSVLKIIEHAESRTAANTRYQLQVAFNYGGQTEIVDAARKLATAARDGLLTPESIDESMFAGALSTSEVGPPDLIIRTSGEQRLSNFLLWEAAYAELVFQDVLWPDYGATHLKAALAEFRRRDRRYGGADVDDVLATG